MSTTRYDQTANARDSNSTTPFRSIWSEETAEQTVTNYQKYRQQLTRDRVAEEEGDREADPDTTAPASFAIESLPDRIKKPVERINRRSSEVTVPENIPDTLFNQAINLLPVLRPFVRVIETAEKYKLRVQDAIAPEIASDECGISIKSPFINITLAENNCRPVNGRDNYQDPTQPPEPSSASGSNHGRWQLFGQENQGKTFTLAWQQTGWFNHLALKTGQTTVTQLHQKPLAEVLGYAGTVMRGIYQMTPDNPRVNSQFAYLGANNVVFYHGPRAGRTGGWNPIAPSPDYNDLAFSNDNNNANFLFTGGYSVTTYRGVAFCHSVARFNTSSGLVNLFYLTVNIRKDITIGDPAQWENVYTGPTSGWNHLAFFEGSASLGEFGSGGNGGAVINSVTLQSWNQSSLRGGANLCPPEIVDFKAKSNPPKLPPPPPPIPKRKCDCMTNCCPQNQSDLSEIKRIIRAMSDKVDKMQKMVGEPEPVPLWDVDITTQGNKVETKKPESITKHLALVNQRLEMALRIIGIHDLPIEVEASASAFENVARMLMSAPNDTLKSIGKTLLDRTTSRVKINSIIGYMTWVQETIHEKLGHWEQELNITDIDLLHDGNQSSKTYFPSIAEMLNTATKYSIDSAVKSEAIINVTTRALLEVVAVKKMLAEMGYQVDATADYLGFEYVESTEDMNVLANLKQKDLSKLEDILKESKIPIRKMVLAKGEQPLESKLVMIQQAAAIIKAVNTIPLGNNEQKGKAIIKEMLKASMNLGGGDDWDDWLKQMNENLGNGELPKEIKEL